MSNVLTITGAVGVISFALVGAWTFARGQYMLAGTSFVLLSFSLYLWETNRDR